MKKTLEIRKIGCGHPNACSAHGRTGSNGHGPACSVREEERKYAEVLVNKAPSAIKKEAIEKNQPRRVQHCAGKVAGRIERSSSCPCPDGRKDLGSGATTATLLKPAVMKVVHGPETGPGAARTHAASTAPVHHGYGGRQAHPARERAAHRPGPIGPAAGNLRRWRGWAPGPTKRWPCLALPALADWREWRERLGAHLRRLRPPTPPGAPGRPGGRSNAKPGARAPRRAPPPGPTSTRPARPPSMRARQPACADERARMGKDAKQA